MVKKMITIDGPAASGKTSVSREIARRFGWNWVSTGAFYRGLAYVALRLKVDLTNEKDLAELATSSQWSVQMFDDTTRVFLGSEDVTNMIFQEDVGSAASKISQFPQVRAALLSPQRHCLNQSQSSGLIAEGRDCGTVVFPDAQLKFYLTARQEDRAARRAKDLGLSVEETVKAQVQRDHQDSTRKTAPLQIPMDAVVVDTTSLNFNQVVDLIEMKMKQHGFQ